MAGNGQAAGPASKADFTSQALKGDKRWGAGVIPYAKRGHWEPDYQPKDRSIANLTSSIIGNVIRVQGPAWRTCGYRQPT